MQQTIDAMVAPSLLEESWENLDVHRARPHSGGRFMALLQSQLFAVCVLIWLKKPSWYPAKRAVLRTSALTQTCSELLCV